MKKTLALLILFSFVLLKPETSQAQVPPKVKAFLTICGYGAGGGAILGAASTAFGTNARAIPQGASLGLYAGILFGTYVLVSHHQRRYGNYDDNSSPYQQSNDIYGDEYQEDEGGPGEGGDGQSGFFNRFQVIQTKLSGMAGEKKGGTLVPPIQMNIFRYEF